MSNSSEQDFLADARRAAHQFAALARERNCRFALAESCTGGLVAALLTAIPGISDLFCGSAVTYREDAKHRWLGIPAGTIDEHSAESQVVTDEMALGVLAATPEASFAASVTGHLGPDAPADIDGVIYIAVAKRHAESEIALQSKVRLTAQSRSDRQTEAAMMVLARFEEAVRADQGSSKE